MCKVGKHFRGVSHTPSGTVKGSPLETAPHCLCLELHAALLCPDCLCPPASSVGCFASVPTPAELGFPIPQGTSWPPEQPKRQLGIVSWGTLSLALGKSSAVGAPEPVSSGFCWNTCQPSSKGPAPCVPHAHTTLAPSWTLLVPVMEPSIHPGYLPPGAPWVHLPKHSPHGPCRGAPPLGVELLPSRVPSLWVKLPGRCRPRFLQREP